MRIDTHGLQRPDRTPYPELHGTMFGKSIFREGFLTGSRTVNVPGRFVDDIFPMQVLDKAGAATTRDRSALVVD